MAETVEAPHVWRGLPLMTGKHSFLGLFNVSENESKGRKNTTESQAVLPATHLIPHHTCSEPTWWHLGNTHCLCCPGINWEPEKKPGSKDFTKVLRHCPLFLWGQHSLGPLGGSHQPQHLLIIPNSVPTESTGTEMQFQPRNHFWRFFTSWLTQD